MPQHAGSVARPDWSPGEIALVQKKSNLMNIPLAGGDKKELQGFLLFGDMLFSPAIDD
jgi:hypothetical protein